MMPVSLIIISLKRSKHDDVFESLEVREVELYCCENKDCLILRFQNRCFQRVYDSGKTYLKQ